VKQSSERTSQRKTKPAAARTTSRSDSQARASETKKQEPANAVVEKASNADSSALTEGAEKKSAEAAPAASNAVATPVVPDSTDKLTFMKRKTGKKWIALTYDDGPVPSFTPRLAEYLKTNNVPATFYLLGQMVKAHPELVKSLAADGFELANHSYTHPDLKRQSAEKVRKELQDTHDLIKEVSGIDVKTMRPPYGNHNSMVDEICKDMGYKVILWDVDTEDWRKRSADSMMNTILKETGDGSIILMHDRKHAGRDTVLEVTRKTVEHFRAKGYTFVTVSQLLDLDDLPTATGPGTEADTVETTGTLARLGASATSSSAMADTPLPAPAIMTPTPLLP
jgi:peptidoglycan/xylan/chitin deacetylase (PgdA/CDA1 family)